MGNPVLPLLDELRLIAQNGLEYADNPYDEERYERILDLVSEHYAELGDLQPSEVGDRFSERVGHVTPNVGGRAAIVNDRGQLLLMKRAGDNTWGLPGGFSAPGETPAETAVREAKEETGLEVDPVELVEFRYRDPDGHNPHGFVGAVYLCRVIGGSLAGSHESDELRYRDIEAVDEWYKDNYRAAQNAITRWKEESNTGQR
ncbi:NUDIX hydrolase N-terminal domain-containing protein [Halomontanus rarus]|uniref:NUDIX hydrolase N-terminal domain-containing protein n=1 Tax=Halomontanus rarus TaxID=3034020 RepID=UPI0023E825A3|nr:NUDIX hydrolase N-terminal domain-containing protein [Halovivax sp. TS33]